SRRGTAVAVTFHPHPAKVLRPRQAPPQLTTLEQKLALLEATGVELALVVPFTLAFARLSPRAFLEQVVCGRLRTEVLCVGDNFRFGHRHAGDVALLRSLAAELNFEIEIVPPVVVGGRTASSTAIRQLVTEGQVGQAAQLLGRPFALTGEIKPGAGRGQKLAFPTLNMAPEQECLPGRGVYVSETVLGEQVWPSATNVGVRPTFDGRGLVVESHLLGFSGAVTGGRLEVRFRERLRAEKKFPTPEALQAQIADDVARARTFFAQGERHEIATEDRRHGEKPVS
ncbi:MAG: riboflavin biosynthesis protein RibF, partial [Terriglobia bacterium]